jgi:hypothetical protein
MVEKKGLEPNENRNQTQTKEDNKASDLFFPALLFNKAQCVAQKDLGQLVVGPVLVRFSCHDADYNLKVILCHFVLMSHQEIKGTTVCSFMGRVFL